jgi:hypothetical protein
MDVPGPRHCVCSTEHVISAVLLLLYVSNYLEYMHKQPWLDNLA